MTMVPKKQCNVWYSIHTADPDQPNIIEGRSGSKLNPFKLKKRWSGSALVSMRIRIQHFRSMRIRIWILLHL